VFTGGLSKSGTFASGTCSNLYCHGNGRSNGNIAHTVTEMTCTSCHADRTQPSQLGGSHEAHLTTTEGGLIRCAECHSEVISTGDTVITGSARHVDGKKDVRMPSGITMDATKTCTGACHGFTHGGLFFPTRTW
jgi:predicted CxxxxCH...CXXCH cytochrome family protein